ncbi:hypothetical protein OHA72_57410 [Dactylosporangium sp. NBC_01737]|uniref:hypothetical protein n=1 Tax=Dactylosporangium sp. NBC_01737 TaxID=2975959 RepID=UPI002E0FA71E|nr:hypothetical protein OHA72_57410 [Dactylosporangium sp. NBC_01737]
MPLTPIRTPTLIGAGTQDGTVAVLVPDPTGLPRLVWTGPARRGLDPAQIAAVRGGGPRPDDDGVTGPERHCCRRRPGSGWADPGSPGTVTAARRRRPAGTGRPRS